MSRLLKKGNLAVLEYPIGCIDPDFDLDGNGVLFVFGYQTEMFGKKVGCAKRFELGLKGYKVVGKYDKAIQKIKGDISDIMEGVDKENCVILFNKNL